MTPTPPHLIVILVDDLGWHNVGFHNKLQISPNIDALVASGAELSRHYTYQLLQPVAFGRCSRADFPFTSMRIIRRQSHQRAASICE